jgi:GR25 family glycosyltransferase involved in LPS biosynthesis
LNKAGIIAERIRAEQDNKKSHINALTLAEKQGFKKAFIFEDDAYFRDGIRTTLLQSIADLERLDWHLLFLHYASWGNLLKRWHCRALKLGQEPEWGKCLIKPDTWNITKNINRINGTKMSHAYVANLGRISDITRALREWQGRHGVDAAYSTAPWLLKYCTTKNLAFQFSCYSDASHYFKKRGCPR